MDHDERPAREFTPTLAALMTEFEDEAAYFARCRDAMEVMIATLGDMNTEPAAELAGLIEGVIHDADVFGLMGVAEAAERDGDDDKLGEMLRALQRRPRAPMKFMEAAE